MKKRIIAALLAACLILAVTVPAAAYETRSATLDYSGISIKLDGAYLTPRDVTGAVVNPFIISGTTYLPVRAVASALGLKVEWEQETQTIYLTSGGARQTLSGGPNTAEATKVKATLKYPGIRIILDGRSLIPRDVNGTAVDPFVIDGTTYLPIRAISSALGLGVDWDGSSLTVLLTTGGAQQTSSTLQATPDHGYYYNQLTAVQKDAYDRIVTAEKRYDASVPMPGISRTDAFTAASAVCFDHPELYWIHDFTLHYVGDSVTEIRYPVPSNVRETVRKLEAAAADILAAAGNGTAYEKALYFYRWIVLNTSYGTTSEGQDITSVLVRHSSACAGYTRAFQYLCHKAGLECGYVEGETSEGTSHSWNFVRLNGRYYWVDPTWGDPVYGEKDDSRINYNYFFVPDSVLYLDHVAYTGFTSGSFRTPDNIFVLPVCTDDSYNYYKNQGSYFESYSRETVGKYLKAKFAAGQYSNIDLKFADAVSYRQCVEDLLSGSNPYIFTLVKEANPGFTGRIAYNYDYVDEARYICLTVTLKS